MGEGLAFPRMTAALRFPGSVGREEGWWLRGRFRSAAAHLNHFQLCLGL